jgi:hypothetical protein
MLISLSLSRVTPKGILALDRLSKLGFARQAFPNVPFAFNLYSFFFLKNNY